MNDSDSKAIVEKFFTFARFRDFDNAEDLLDDNLVWWVAGDPKLFPMAGTQNKEEVMQGLKRTASASPSGMEFTPTGWVVEGDKVALEAVVDGDFANGEHYHNEYHFLCEVKNNKITLIKEYFDTLTAHVVFAKGIEDAAETE